MRNTSHPDGAFRRRRIAFVLAAAALLPGGCQRNANDGKTVLSGNIEVVDAQLAFDYPGRVAERPVSEGQQVTQGQLIARQDDSEQKQNLALAQAELAAARAALAELQAGSRPQEIASAEASLNSAEAERDLAQQEFNRQQELLSKSVVSHQAFDSAQAQLKVAEARAAAAGEQLKLVQEGPRAETIAQARARVEQADASVGLAQTRLDKTRLVSPLTGVVLSHNVEPGEYVSAGTPVATVADLANVWVRAYISQTDLGRIRLGEKLDVHTDSFPDKTYQGTVSFIASDAEFTPKTVQTAQERVKLVYRIKVDVANPDGELKPGMPADVVLPAGS